MALHTYLTIRGGYEDPRLSQEVWQVGIRLRVSGDVGADTGLLPTDWTVVPENAERQATHGTVSTLYRLEGPGAASFSPDDYLEDQAEPAIRAFWSNWGCSSKIRINEFRLYPVESAIKSSPPAGKSAYVARYAYTTPLPGPYVATSMPPTSVALCASWNTHRLGAKGKGRIYMPAPGSGMADPAGQIGTTSTQADAASELISDLTYLGTGVRIFPIVTGGNFTEYAKIKSVRVGTVYDTQRRRRNRVNETYSVSPV